MKEQSGNTMDIWQAINEINATGITITARMSDKDGYGYVPLADTLNALKKPLKEHGLSVVQIPFADGSNVIIRTRISKGEEFIVLEYKQQMFSMHNLNIAQANASVITQTRNIILKSLFGIITEEDTNASEKEIKKKMIIAGTDEYKNLVKEIKNGNTTLEQAKEIYNISKATLSQLELTISL